MNTLKLKALLPTESQEATSLIQWAHVRKHNGFRLSSLLLMIPNGVKLGGTVQQRCMTMARLKSQGFRVGISDYLLAIPIAPYAGLWVELKRRHLSVTSPEQTQFQLDMIAQGYQAVICRGWEEAKAQIDAYLGEA